MLHWANTNRLKWRGRWTNGCNFSFQISLRATVDSSGVRTVSVFPLGGDVTDTRCLWIISEYHRTSYQLNFSFQDCTDGTDESNCTQVSCPDDKFNCPQVCVIIQAQSCHCFSWLSLDYVTPRRGNMRVITCITPDRISLLHKHTSSLCNVEHVE